MRESLLEVFEENDKVAWFEYEEDQFYSKRESELTQQYLQVHGEMPGGARTNWMISFNLFKSSGYFFLLI